MLNIKLVKLNKIECSWAGLGVPVVTDYTVATSVKPYLHVWVMSVCGDVRD
jgi:hypothetical protein